MASPGIARDGAAAILFGVEHDGIDVEASQAPLTCAPEINPTTQSLPGASPTSARLTTGPFSTGTMRRRAVAVAAQPLARANEQRDWRSTDESGTMCPQLRL